MPAATPHGFTSPPGASEREIPVLWALVPVVSLILLLFLVIVVVPMELGGAAAQSETTSKFEGSGHFPLILAGAIGALVAARFGWKWHAIHAGMLYTINLAMGAVLILLVIGVLMATWMASGIVPALISWGLELMAPSFFLPATCAVCSFVSLVTGSSWSTAGTVGVALIGVAQAMGIDPAMTAGAIISGAYFGDKLSPMSDTTNLAPAMAGSDLFAHIRHMLWTTGPSWVIAMATFTIVGLTMNATDLGTSVDEIQTLLQEKFDPGPVHLVIPVLVIAMVFKRSPPLPTLALGAGLGGVLAMFRGVQLSEVLSVGLNGYVSSTGNAAVDELLSRGGMFSMHSTVFLILAAMVFSGVLERTGMLRVLAFSVLSRADSTRSLIASTVLTSIGANILAADQYISVVVPGRMYAEEYRRRGLAPQNLSRALEDGGTITSPLIPWNTCGAFMSAALGVATGSYAMYCFLNLANPIVSIFYGVTGWTILKAPEQAGSQAPDSGI
ncbi:MAG: Na+/H+ antiporter NhaC [Proteobacteria bacterium]|nr:Na+/H+ antiporter NhaC [Pseudomonadota bacterium]